MKINTTTSRETTVYEIAGALADATPDEFGAVFLRLSELVLKDEGKLMAFAEAMADDHGSNRKKILKELLQRVAYFEGKRRYEPIPDATDGEPT